MSYAPSLFDTDTQPSAMPPSALQPSYQVRSLLDLLYDGFLCCFC